MWYGKQESLNYSEPIIAEGNGNKYLLLPQIKEKPTTGGNKRGFNWFNLKTGTYNSSCFFETAEKAIKSYAGHKIYNAKIIIEEL